MAFETYIGAFERAMARLVTTFGESPDVCLSQVDLHGALFLHLLGSNLLDALYTTRDGRRTPLVHQQYAATPFLDREFGEDAAAGSDSYDIVLMNPSFVRGSDMDVVARHQALRAACRTPQQEQPLPLLAAANLVVIDSLCPANLELIEQRFYTLVHAERDALRAYLGVFLRQWELDEEAQHGLRTIESWARQQPYVSVCCIQSYRDRAGHVFAGRYLNDWNHEAPLLPLELPTTRHVRPAAPVHGGQSDQVSQLLGQGL